MSQFTKGSALSTIVSLLERGAIKKKYVVEIFTEIMNKKMLLNHNLDNYQRDYKMLEEENHILREKLQNMSITIRQSSEYDTNPRRDDGDSSGDDVIVVVTMMIV